ncbi:hypothetical protein QQP08_005011, partial [Theobroma cacao]
AKEYFEKAAYNKDAGQYYNLGVMYLRGIGVKKDVKIACKCFIVAANAGQTKPFYQLGRMMAERGYEIAQSNAAWILDKYGEHNMWMDESGLCTDAERHQRAHSLSWQASEQGSYLSSPSRFLRAEVAAKEAVLGELLGSTNFLCAMFVSLGAELCALRMLFLFLGFAIFVSLSVTLVLFSIQ